MTGDRRSAPVESCDHRCDHGLRLRRLPDQEVTGWHRYRVFDGDQPVGLVHEHREWRGWRYGGQRWMAAHNPTGGDWAACWCSTPVETRRAALEALRVHLDGHLSADAEGLATCRGCGRVVRSPG